MKIREQSKFTGGGGSIRRGKDLSARKLEGGAEFECKASGTAKYTLNMNKKLSFLRRDILTFTIFWWMSILKVSHHRSTTGPGKQCSGFIQLFI